MRVVEAHESAEKEKPVTWAEQFEFSDLFRVKGKKGLYFPASTKHKSGVVMLREWEGTGRCVTHARNLQRLSELVFHKEDGTVLSITEVMDNIDQNLKLEEIPGINKFNARPPVLERIVPGYDPAMFKPSHAVQVLSWWAEIKRKTEDTKPVKTEEDEK